MADVIGPNSYLPGRRLKAPKGATCDDHPDRLAVAGIVGETDSFGSEILHLCQECVDEIENSMKASQSQERYCEWHKGMGKDVRHMRDYEEGSTGPVYMVCSDCRQKSIEDAREEYEYILSHR